MKSLNSRSFNFTRFGFLLAAALSLVFACQSKKEKDIRLDPLSLSAVDENGKIIESIDADRDTTLYFALNQQPENPVKDLKIQVSEVKCGFLSEQNFGLVEMEFAGSNEIEQSSNLLSGIRQAYGPVTIQADAKCSENQFVEIIATGRGSQQGVENTFSSSLFLRIDPRLETNVDNYDLRFHAYSVDQVVSRKNFIVGEEFHLQFVLENISDILVQDIDVSVSIAGDVEEALLNFPLTSRESLRGAAFLELELPVNLRVLDYDSLLANRGEHPKDQVEIVLEWKSKGKKLRRQLLNIPIKPAISVMATLPTLEEVRKIEAEDIVVDIELDLLNTSEINLGSGSIEIGEVKNGEVYLLRKSAKIEDLSRGQRQKIPRGVLAIKLAEGTSSMEFELKWSTALGFSGVTRVQWPQI